MAASEGVDLEWAIVETARRQKSTRNYSPKIKAQADKCVAHIVKAVGNNFEIYHSDDNNIPGMGGKGIFAKPEPKTDIVIIAKNKKYFVSVKMEGGIQLASGQGASTAELFEAAASGLKNTRNAAVLKSIIKSLKTMPTRLLSESNFQRIMDEGNEKVINEFMKRVLSFMHDLKYLQRTIPDAKHDCFPNPTFKVLWMKDTKKLSMSLLKEAKLFKTKVMNIGCKITNLN